MSIDVTSPITDAEWVAIGKYGTLDPRFWAVSEHDW